MNSALKKLVEEIEKNAGEFPFKPKGGKPEAGNEKDGGKKFPPKSEGKPGDTKNQNGNNDKKENGKVSDSGKKPEGEKKEAPKFGKDNEGKNPEANGANGNQEGRPGEGNENQNPGNGTAQGAAASGAGAIDPTAIIDFFAQNPKPDSQAFNDFAQSQGIDANVANTVAYTLAGKYVMFLRGGKSSGKDISQVDPAQLDKGIQVEMEHTSDMASAKKIALDHITGEMPDYYDRLEQMEGVGGEVVAKPKQEQSSGDQQNKGQPNKEQQNKEQPNKDKQGDKKKPM